MRLSFALALASSVPAPAAFFGEVSPRRSFVGKCALALVAPVLAYAAWSDFAPSISHDLKAHAQGKEHLAYGIYLDMPRILDTLSDNERALLADPRANADAIATLFMLRLSGDYDSDLASGEDGKGPKSIYWPEARDASTYLLNQNNGQPRGICRHKAVILHGILNALGIENQIYRAVVSKNGNSGHVWVQIGNRVYDPTDAQRLPLPLYLKYLSAAHGRENIQPEVFQLRYFMRGYMY